MASVVVGGLLFDEGGGVADLGFSSDANISSQSLSLKVVDGGASCPNGATGCELLTLDEKLW